MSKPLEGIKVVEIAQEIQGPFASLILADMGADVVKVENKETGDLSRWMLAALIGGPDVKNATVSHYFIAMNRGKRSITADLKKPDAIEMIRRMVKSFDVLVTNYRPGVLDRLGLGYDDVRKINPRIVYAQGSSWGPRGPWVTRPSRDTLAQAASGVMAKTGMPADPPLAAGMFVADHSGALSLASGVLAALFARERTGKGQKVDASIYGTMIAMQGMEINYTSITGVEPERAGRGHQFLRGVWGAFPTRDGYICIAGVDEKRWPSFCKIVGIQHLEKDPELFGQRHSQFSRRQNSESARRNLPGQDQQGMAQGTYRRRHFGDRGCRLPHDVEKRAGARQRIPARTRPSGGGQGARVRHADNDQRRSYDDSRGRARARTTYRGSAARTRLHVGRDRRSARQRRRLAKTIQAMGASLDR